MNCPFCTNEQIQERIVYKDEVVMMFPTNIPITPGHMLVCPTRHVGKIDELTNDETIALKNTIVRLKCSLAEAVGAEGFNVAWNEGGMAGQSVNHLHIHVVPRKTGDAGIYEYEPRQFLYRPGAREESPQQELKEVAEMVKKVFK